MGQVLVVVRVMPEEAGGEKAVRAALEALKGFDICQVKEAPVAFGLVALRVGVVLEDEAKALARLEKALSSLPGVGGVEVEGSTLL